MSVTLDRRQFLNGLGGLVATGSVIQAGQLQAQPADTKPLAIIDTHQHLWDVKRDRLPWLKTATTLNRTYSIADYDAATEGLNVVKAIYMEIDIDPNQQVEEATRILEICESRRTKTIAAVISAPLGTDQLGSYLDRFRDDKPLKGVRQVLHRPDSTPDSWLKPEFVKDIQLLGERKLSFDLCLKHQDLKAAAQLVDAAPDTAFILDHCGNPDVLAKDLSSWKAGIETLASRDRVVCKVSGILASTQGKPWTADDLAPVVNHVLDTFGPDRVMFGGDWPVCTLGGSYRQWVEALKSIVKNRPIDQQKKLFHGNAERYFRLA